MKIKKIISKQVMVVLLIATIVLCFIKWGKKNLSNNVQLGFYCWSMKDERENFYDNSTTYSALPASVICTKIMDIDWDDALGPVPVATKIISDISDGFHDSLFKDKVLVPCIFITNKTIEKIQEKDIEVLSQKVFLKAKQLIEKKGKYEWDKEMYPNLFKLIDSIAEIQIDCDWTAGTKNKYFELLRLLQKKFAKYEISSTLRLHQYRDRDKMGIPPVKQVYLMCYNTGDVKNEAEKNSIINQLDIKNYINNVEAYPLKINIALPLFDWVVIYKKNKFYKIDNSFDVRLFADTNYAKPIDSTKYLVIKDTVIGNLFLRAGNVLRIESVSKSDLIGASEICKQAVNSNNYRVVYFDINHAKKMGYENIKNSFDIISH